MRFAALGGSRRRLLLAVGLLLLALAVPAMGQNPSGFLLHVTSASGESGSTTLVQVLLDIDTDPIAGWSFGICHDPGVVSITGAVLGADVAALNPTFSNINPGLGGGVTVGVVLSFLDPTVMLAVGTNLQLLDVTYSLDGAAGSSSAITPCPTLGSPPVAVLVVAATDEISPDTAAGTIDIVAAGPLFRRGDANRDGQVNIVDAVRVLELLFLSTDPLVCEDEIDVNDNGNADLVDVVFLLQNLFLAGTPIPPPSPACGLDPTADLAGCTSSAPLCP